MNVNEWMNSMLMLRARNWKQPQYPSTDETKHSIYTYEDQSCPTPCNPVDCSLPGFSVHGISQARILEWVAISYSSVPEADSWMFLLDSFTLWLPVEFSQWKMPVASGKGRRVVSVYCLPSSLPALLYWAGYFPLTKISLSSLVLVAALSFASWAQE